jgi:hypothetical protein
MSNGGIIGVINTPTTSVASGVWTLNEVLLARSQSIWPAVVVTVLIDYLVVAGGAGGAGHTVPGGGGAGAGSPPGGSGGSGVVILRYPDAYTISNPGGGLTFTTATDGSDKVTTVSAGTGNVSWS